MKSELSKLLEERNLDAVIIEGPDGLGRVNASFRYMTRGQELTGAVVVVRGREPVLLFHPMEKQQAEASGLKSLSYGQWDLPWIMKKFPNRLEAAVEIWRAIFADLGVRGRVAWSGVGDIGSFIALLRAIERAIPGIEVVGEFDKPLVAELRKTKDADEIALLADIGRRTSRAVQQVLADISSTRRARDGVVTDPSGKPLTIGEVKRMFNHALELNSLEPCDEMIFSQGSDAGVAHARGNDAEPLRCGTSVILDIFPRDRATGYYHDMTRTFAFGHADPDVQKLYNDVKHAFERVMRDLRVGERTKHYQDETCRIFREFGHPVIADTWPLEEGYYHSLGHGLGLEVHEPLAFSSFVDRGDRLAPGHVFTIEPGLYYPSRGMGVRIEDTVVCDLTGTFRSLSPMPYDLLVPLRDA